MSNEINKPYEYYRVNRYYPYEIECLTYPKSMFYEGEFRLKIVAIDYHNRKLLNYTKNQFNSCSSSDHKKYHKKYKKMQEQYSLYRNQHLEYFI